MESTAKTGARFGGAWPVVLAFALAGCGGAAPMGSATPPPPVDIEGALAQLDRAEGELELLLPQAPDGAQAFAQAPGQPMPPPAATESAPERAAPKAGTPVPAAEPVQAAPPASTTPPESPCALAHRALASMQRATTELCSMAGDADVRCESARSRTDRATGRVASSCPG